MADKVFRSGPTALTNTYTTNVLNPTSALVDYVIEHIHIANKTNAAVTFRLYLGATGANAAGTELFFDKTVPANDAIDWYPRLRMTSSDFLVGGASAATSLTILIEGRQIVA